MGGLPTLVAVERNTRDLARALAFYRDALGFCIDDANAPPPAWTRLPGMPLPTRCACLSLGAQHLVFTEFPNAAPYPADSASNDAWFQHCAIVTRDMHAAHARVLQHGATKITQGGPQTLPPATGSVQAFKFRDPDGRPLELLQFPPGSGDPQWQAPGATHATLGIDHTAISVADVERSIGFYTRLGLRVVARGVNRGVQQQRLDQLADVAVDVIALVGAARTPHLELLGYRHPRGCLRSDIDVTAIASDRQQWRTRAALDASADADLVDALLAQGRVGGTIAALWHDPDGHLLALEHDDA